MSLLIVGTQRNKNLPPERGALDSMSGTRLSRLMDRPLLMVAYTANLFEPHEVVTTVCKERCQEQLRWAERHGVERIVFLLQPRRAGLKNHEWFTWYQQLTGVEIAFSPHPSGLNRWWNDRDNYKLAALFWSDLGEWTDKHALPA